MESDCHPDGSRGSESQVLVCLEITLICGRLFKKLGEKFCIFLEINDMLVGGREHSRSFYKSPVSINEKREIITCKRKSCVLGVCANGVRKGRLTPVRIFDIRQSTVFHIVINCAMEVRPSPGQPDRSKMWSGPTYVLSNKSVSGMANTQNFKS